MAGYTATIRGVVVHVDELMAICHSCDPQNCAHKATCCGAYEVHVTPRELTSIIGLLEEARVRSRRLQDEDIFEEVDDGLALGTDEEGVCVFAYTGSEGQTLCSLHTVAMDHGLDPFSVKPRDCVLWPLTISTGSPRHLAVVDDALEWPCNQLRPAGASGLDEGIAAIVAHRFGQPFLRELQEICSRRGYSGHYESDAPSPQQVDHPDA